MGRGASAGEGEEESGVEELGEGGELGDGKELPAVGRKEVWEEGEARVGTGRKKGDRGKRKK